MMTDGTDKTTHVHTGVTGSDKTNPEPPTPQKQEPPKSEPPPTAIGPDGDEVRTDNYPPATYPALSRQYAVMYRASLILQKKALQEHIRAIGMQIAALEKEFGIGDQPRNQPAV